jgi:hypothetical protein
MGDDSEIIERKATLVPSDEPVQIRLDIGGGLGASWVFRRIYRDAVLAVEQGDTSGGDPREWSLPLADLPIGAEVQVSATVMAPAVEAPWQIGVDIRQGRKTRLSKRVALAGTLSPRTATTRVVRVRIVAEGTP